MEPIKISIEVNLDLSEQTKSFIAGLVSKKPAEQPKAAEQKPAEKKPAEKKPAEKKSSITIDDIRSAVMEKINDSRDAIKEKLESFGVPNVTKLPEENYEEMYNFLKEL